MTADRLEADVKKVGFKLGKNTLPFAFYTAVRAAVSKAIPKLGPPITPQRLALVTLASILLGLYDSRETAVPLVADIMENEGAALEAAEEIAQNRAVPAINQAADDFIDDPRKSAERATKATVDFTKAAVADFFTADTVDS